MKNSCDLQSLIYSIYLPYQWVLKVDKKLHIGNDRKFGDTFGRKYQIIRFLPRVKDWNLPNPPKVKGYCGVIGCVSCKPGDVHKCRFCKMKPSDHLSRNCPHKDKYYAMTIPYSRKIFNGDFEKEMGDISYSIKLAMWQMQEPENGIMHRW